MATTPQKRSSTWLSSIGLGPKLIGLAVVLFVVTRIIVWLPLGLLGNWINGILWSVVVLSLLAGIGITYLKSSRNK